jgi:hypothetical protein
VHALPLVAARAVAAPAFPDTDTTYREHRSIDALVEASPAFAA